METYIVRIYRLQQGNPRHLVGIVESVEGERRGKRAFTTFDDLWEILNSHMAETILPQQGKVTKRVEKSDRASSGGCSGGDDHESNR